MLFVLKCWNIEFFFEIINKIHYSESSNRARFKNNEVQSIIWRQKYLFWRYVLRITQNINQSQGSAWAQTQLRIESHLLSFFNGKCEQATTFKCFVSSPSYWECYLDY